MSSDDAAETGPGESPDPLAYAPGDGVGIALDVDGTVHEGSIFVETLAYLPYVGCPLSADDRAARRDALLSIAEYGGGQSARRRWARLLAALDGLGRIGAGRLAASIMGLLARADANRSGTGSSAADRDRPSYETTQDRILSAYGRILAGRRPEALRPTIRQIVASRLSIDDDCRTTLARIDRNLGADVVLVTHAPEAIARAYADRLLGDPDRAVGTRYELDRDGRYTGAYEKLAKGPAIDRLRTDREWTYVVAAGDSGVDLAMADRANLFLAVDGEGDLAAHLDGRETVPAGDPDRIRAAMTDGVRIVRIDGVRSTAGALERSLSAVGIGEE